MSCLCWSCANRRTASETGDYRFCIDNSFSHFASKVVYFELYANDGDDSDDDAMFDALADTDTDYDVKLDDFKVTLDLTIITDLLLV